MTDPNPGTLQRHFGLLHATALNVTFVVGAGVFITIPPMLTELPGAYALLGWVVAGALMLVDSMVWSELGATLPGSGGSYLYLLESYGRQRWGRLMAFLFIWQFLISGPLEVASGLIAISTFSNALSPTFEEFNRNWTWDLMLRNQGLTVAFGPSRLIGFGLGLLMLLLLYRRITILGRMTLVFWLGVLAAIAWILAEGWPRFDAGLAFRPPPAAVHSSFSWKGLGGAMRLAMYSYLGYYAVCYIGDEVRDPGRTIPRSILMSATLVCLLFIALHLAMLGTVPWDSVPNTQEEMDRYSLPAAFMRRIHEGDWAATLVTLCLIWSSFGAAFAALLGYSRIPYGAARYGHFFSVFGRVHPVHHIPHVSLLLVGALTLFWSFFSLQSVIDAMIVTRILEQFIGQIAGVVLLRRRDPQRVRPFKLWLYPLPCGLALLGWLYMYLTAEPLFIALGLVTLLAGGLAFLIWSWKTGGWPFASQPAVTGC